MGVGYKKCNKDITAALSDFKKYEYALLYNMSSLILDKTESMDLTNIDECLEAYFFSSDKMLHIFEYNGELKAVEIVDEDDNAKDTIIKKYTLNTRFNKIGRVVVVQEYLNFDEDGQAFVELTRLKGIE